VADFVGMRTLLPRNPYNRMNSVIDTPRWNSIHRHRRVLHPTMSPSNRHQRLSLVSIDPAA
jgi:hypothetical protein